MPGEILIHAALRSRVLSEAADEIPLRGGVAVGERLEVHDRD